jgi:peptidoglycan/xylan/chitin deacetylase (PgdA/CDA1 family)
MFRRSGYKFLAVLTILSLLVCSCGSKNSDSVNSPATQPPPSHQATEAPSTQLDSIKNIYNYAQKGFIQESEFGVLNHYISQVEKQWGKADQVDKAGVGTYATYTKNGVAFGYNQSGQIFDVRSYRSELQKLTLADIERVLGKSKQTSQSGKDHIYVYAAAAEIELKFIIPESTQTVDHISVFSAQSLKEGNVVVPTPTPSYYLDILGNSNQLSAEAWRNMQIWRKQIVSFAKQHPKQVFINGPNEKRIALTFDDGPDQVNTPDIIDILKKYKVPGNFFFIGAEVKRLPEVVQKAYDNGNLVLGHSYKHDDLTKLNDKELIADLKLTEEAIEGVIGKKPAMIRNPYGETNDKVVSAASKNGNSIVLWSIDTLDWSQKESKNIVGNVLNNVRNGDIILMHSSAEQAETVKALPLMIEGLQKRNFKIVDLETMLQIPAYK